MNRAVEAPDLLHANELPGAHKVAVIVCHGMGQQVPFETLGVLIDSVEGAKQRGNLPDVLSNTTIDRRAVHMLPAAEGRLLPVARIEVTPPSAARRTLDFYEAYWAPVTAGRVRLIDSILFYFSTGWLGIQFGLGRSFDRRLGDTPPKQDQVRGPVPGKAGIWRFSLKWTLPFKLALALIVLGFIVLAIVAVELLSVLVAANYARVPGFQDIPAPFLITHGLVWAGVAVILLLLAIIASMFGRAKAHRPEVPTTVDREELPRSRGRLFWLIGQLVFLVLVAAPIALGLIGTSWLWHRWAPASTFSDPMVFLVVTLGLLGAVLWLRRFLIEYTGDVAAYMSAHRVSRFAEIRNEIQARCCLVMNYVYGLTRRDQKAGYEYDEVIVVGHSLGSVVAYDTLNDVIARDRAGPSVNAAERTSLLLTLGSPLDKIAFIFRSQKPSDTIGIREELAAERQPMLLSPSFRPQRWVNIYHWLDWIASALDYFNLQPLAPGVARRTVDNVLDNGGWFGNAHTGYWKRRTVGRVMLWAAAGFPGPRPHVSLPSVRSPHSPP